MADIPVGEEIFREASFLEQEPDFVLLRPELENDPECQALRDKLEVFAEKYCDLPEGAEKYPPEVRAIMERLTDRGHALTYENLSPAAKLRYTALHDCFKPHAPNTPVIIVGRENDSALLNGKSGVATQFQGHRWAVRLSSGEVKAIEPINLKTPGGIWMTNAVESPGTGTQCIVTTLARINHSCVPNTRKLRSRSTGEWVLRATMNIRSGEELCISYGVGGGSASERRQLLERKWKFTCHCKSCEAGWTLTLDEAESQRVWC